MRCFGLVLLVLTLAGCGGPTANGRLVGGPPPLQPFPSLRQEGPIQVQASFKARHAQMLRIDLVRDMRILPIWIEVSIDPGEGGSVEISADRLGLMLHLQDGQALAELPAAKLLESRRLGDQSRRRIRQEELGSAFLEPGKRVDGFVFFQLPPEPEFVLRDGMQLAHTSGGFTKIVDLYGSVVSLQLDDGVRRTVYLGIDR